MKYTAETVAITMKRQILADGRLYDGLKGVVGLNSALLRLKNRPAVRTMLILSAPKRMGPKGATMSPILYSSIYRSPQWYKNYRKMVKRVRSTDIQIERQR